ncbi:methyltransferase domain-containing protein [Bradyrhizobium barranii]|uniref:Methyltransferase domain-containing protein n=1 Tax=Bradyrhizobium barranii TaxID=2992140 RepID=A0ABY3QZK3_9BRAD|nr:methyltransferase domain-containing protein [Bradyrhizobium japonicum]UFW91028.1 methyltransferase domain-containing protein [Bradyrhizobium japonicum]
MLNLNADITGLRGAEYNPRRINEDDLKALAGSITELGLVKPLIVRGDLLVAGHQRTKALRHLGITRAAVYFLSSETTLYDEIKFNQFHNGTDVDNGDENARITGGFDKPGWHQVDIKRLTANWRSGMSIVREDICSLIQRFGPWGGVVSTMSGEIIHAAQYALAARAKNVPLTVHVLPDDKIARARELLSKQYGVFSYDKLERKTYIQTLAQMNRLRAGEGSAAKRDQKSSLYETLVVPFAQANKDLRYIDFGSGHGDYAKAMRLRGFDFHDVELFRRKGSSSTLDGTAVNLMIDKLCSDLRSRGRYDAVVCDSVMNSVDSLEAEHAVMTMINSLCKVGGNVFFSGRTMESVHSRLNHTKTVNTNQRRGVEFLDEHGFSALYRNGVWFYQKFHDAKGIEKLCADHGLAIVKRTNAGTSWQAHAKKVLHSPEGILYPSIDFEFNLPFGEEKRIGRHEDVKAAFRAAAQ